MLFLKRDIKLIFVFFLTLLLISNICYASFESESIFGLEEPDGFSDIDFNSTNPSPEKKDSDSISIVPVGGTGKLHVVIETITASNHKVFSQKADRAEIWLGHILLSRLDLEDVKVINTKTNVIFDFPSIELKSGYYFISIKLYSNGKLWKKHKYHEQIYQVGIHENKITNLYKKIPFFNW